MATTAHRAQQSTLGNEPTPDVMRHALAGYPTGIAVVTAEIDGRPVGMLANSFTSISLAPPLVSVAFAHTSTTWPALRRAPAWGISVLGNRDAELVRTLSRPGEHRFDGVEMVREGDGALVLPQAVAALTVTLHTEIDAGDHILTLLRVHTARRDIQHDPLIFYDSSVRQLRT